MTYGIHPLGTPPASTELVWEDESTPATSTVAHSSGHYRTGRGLVVQWAQAEPAVTPATARSTRGWDVRALRDSRVQIPQRRASGGAPVVLVVADGAHAHASDALVLTAAATLGVGSCDHTHVADAPSLVAAASLVGVAPADHGHAADHITLSTSGAVALSVADGQHAQLSDAVGLVVASALAAAESSHAHVTDDIVLEPSGTIVLAPVDASHAHGADALALSAVSVLAASPATHQHAADQIILDDGLALGLADGAHGHWADVPALSVAASLLLADARHAHATDPLWLDVPGGVVLSVPPIGRRWSTARRPPNLSERAR